MVAANPGSVLFCCDYNAVRSPMAEGLLKQHVGQTVYVQSAGVKNDLEIDGFSIAVCKEIGVELSKHRVRTMDEMVEWGDDLDLDEVIKWAVDRKHKRSPSEKLFIRKQLKNIFKNFSKRFFM